MTKWFCVSMETKLQCQIDGKMRSIQIYTDQIAMLKQCKAISTYAWGGYTMMSNDEKVIFRMMSN
jgi:hypothetical protein